MCVAFSGQVGRQCVIQQLITNIVLTFGYGEMVQRLKVGAALEEGPSSLPSTHVWQFQLQLPINPAPGDPVHIFMPSQASVLIYTYPYIYTYLKTNSTIQGWKSDRKSSKYHFGSPNLTMPTVLPNGSPLLISLERHMPSSHFEGMGWVFFQWV